MKNIPKNPVKLKYQKKKPKYQYKPKLNTLKTEEN